MPVVYILHCCNFVEICIQLLLAVFGSGIWSHITTHLVLFFLLRWPLPEKPKALSFQIRFGWNLARLFLEWICIDWRSRISDMKSYFQDVYYFSCNYLWKSNPLSLKMLAQKPSHTTTSFRAKPPGDIVGSQYALIHLYLLFKWPFLLQLL